MSSNLRQGPRNFEHDSGCFWAVCLLDYMDCFLTPLCIFYINNCVRQTGRKAITDGLREWSMEVGRERKQVKVWQEIGRKCSWWKSEPVQVFFSLPNLCHPFLQCVPVHACTCVCNCGLMHTTRMCFAGQTRDLRCWKPNWASTLPHPCLICLFS